MKKQIVAMMILVSSLMAMTAHADQVEWKPVKPKPVGTHNCQNGEIEEGKCTYKLMPQSGRDLNVNIPEKSNLQITLLQGCDAGSLVVTDQDYHQIQVYGQVTLHGNGTYVLNNTDMGVCSVAVEVVAQ